ncbi:MAG: sulfatase [Candidatus Omnitrophica bacterium]|nr:sulfatase [Candidatus Omnitrophota bacterium]
MTTSRRGFLKQTGLASAWMLSSGWSAVAQERFNVLWIVAEDFCPDLGCYGNPLVDSPNIDRLAGEGVRFTNAFTTAPVCSASRSAFMTGMYQTSIGAHNHRSHRDDGYRLPEGVRLITDYFREAGYFTCNMTNPAPGVKGTGKTDFNFNDDRPFDGKDWSERKEGQPFFAQVNFPETHRNFKRAKENGVDPAAVEIPPCYPDDPITRRDWADYLDTVRPLDQKVGAVLKRLDEEGLAENTIVVFMGDHGYPHVWGKQWLYDGGIHIPLIIRWPGRIKPGSVNDELISSIDLTASLVNIAGVKPQKMEGRVFLGLDRDAPRDYIVAARDRCDETVDRIRCVRTRQFKYIRNFFPERPYSQMNKYKETQYPVMRLLRRLHKQGKLNEIQAKFMAPTRPKEELYDLQSDPHEIHNLAGDPSHAEPLQKMRAILDRWIEETGDQGAIPEDPSIPEFYRIRAQNSYDKRLKQLYEEEGMEWFE